MNYHFSLSLIFVILIFGSCTGQNPVELKKSTNLKNSISSACTSMRIEGKVLTKENILNIFECSGWSKRHPNLFNALTRINEKKINNVFSPLNEETLSDKFQQNNFFKSISNAEKNNQLDPFAKIIEKVLANSDVTVQFRKFVEAKGLSQEEKKAMLKVISPNNAENIKILTSFRAIINSFEEHGNEIRVSLKNQDKDDLSLKVTNILDDVSGSLGVMERRYLSEIIYHDGSPLKTWSENSIESGSELVNSVIVSKDFSRDVKYLQKHLSEQITCKNKASKRDFSVSINQDIKNKINSLRYDTREKFQSNLLHGMSIYLSFQQFCEEEKESKGLKSFFNVLNYTFGLASSEVDFNFLKKIHLILKDDSFAFLSFLNSSSFMGVRDLLIDLKKNSLDLDFVLALHRVVANVSDENLEVLSNLFIDSATENSRAYAWFNAWSNWWPTLSKKEKIAFVNLLSLFVEGDIEVTSAVDFIIDLLQDFPGLAEKIYRSLDDPSFQNDLVDVLQAFEEDSVQKDLSEFLSNKGIFEFFKLLSNNSDARSISKTINQKTERLVDAHPLVLESTLEIKNIFQKKCFDELSERYLDNPSYYAIVNNLPDTCLRSLGDVGLVGQIYLWMNQGNKFFRENYKRTDFHNEAGVWSPAMLHFIFSFGITANETLFSVPYGHGLKNNLAEIGNYLLSDYVQNSFSLFSQLYTKSSKHIDFESKLQNYIELRSDEEITDIVNMLFDTTKNVPSVINVKTINIDCRNLNEEQGVSTCLPSSAINSKLLDIVRILKAKNNSTGVSLIQGLIQWLHPDGGILLPLNGNNPKKVGTNLEEIILFLYDLSSDKTAKSFSYFSDVNSKVRMNGTTIDRLEVLIREIGFVDNFYGAYFKNNVAHAQDYKKVISNSESLVGWMDTLNGVARTLFGLPKSAAWKFKTIKSVYSSLSEVADNYIQPDGSTKSYDDFIQGLLSVIVASSRQETQSFNPYQKPKTELVRGHNGIFLTRMVELSALRHLAQYVRSRLTDISILKEKRFVDINKNLFKKIEMKYLQAYFQNILEKYFDNDRNQLNLLLSDIINFTSTANQPDLKSLEEILIKLAIIFSSEKLTSENLKLIFSYTEVFIRMWPEIHEMLDNINIRHELLSNLNKQLNVFVERPELLNSILETLKASQVISPKDVEVILGQKDLRIAIEDFIVHLSKNTAPQTQVNWSETLRNMFANNDIKWQPIVDWLDTAIDRKPSDKLTVSLLLSFLAEKNGNGTKFKIIIEELFINHKKQFEDFLEDIFPALRLKSNFTK